jgi:hypothetical protein
MFHDSGPRRSREAFQTAGFEPILRGTSKGSRIRSEFADFDCRAAGAFDLELIWANEAGRAMLLELRMGKPHQV